MTHPLVPVIQTDRNAASTLTGWTCHQYMNVRDGKLDDHPNVQAFARYRIFTTIGLVGKTRQTDEQPPLVADLIDVLAQWLSNAEAGFLDEIPTFKPDVYQNQLVADTVAVLEKVGFKPC